jgi:hypothetical protein
MEFNYTDWLTEFVHSVSIFNVDWDLDIGWENDMHWSRNIRFVCVLLWCSGEVSLLEEVNFYLQSYFRSWRWWSQDRAWLHPWTTQAKTLSVCVTISILKECGIVHWRYQCIHLEEFEQYEWTNQKC